MARMRTRWGFSRILTDQITVRSSATFVVEGDLSEVWTTLMDPRTELEMDPRIFDAGRMGPTRGLGEIQYALYRRDEGGSARITGHEVIEYEHERRALTQGMTYVGHHTRTETVVESDGPGRVRISLQWWRGFPEGTPAREVLRAYRARKESVDSSVRRYARVLTLVPD